MCAVVYIKFLFPWFYIEELKLGWKAHTMNGANFNLYQIEKMANLYRSFGFISGSGKKDVGQCKNENELCV